MATEHTCCVLHYMYIVGVPAYWLIARVGVVIGKGILLRIENLGSKVKG